MAAKAAIKKISKASAKKAQAFMRADKKKTERGMQLAYMPGGGKGAFERMKKNKIFSVMPAAAGDPGKFRASVNSAVSKKLSSLSKKQLRTISQSMAGPLLSSKVKGQIKNALDRFKKPSRQKGGGMSKGKKYI